MSSRSILHTGLYTGIFTCAVTLFSVSALAADSTLAQLTKRGEMTAVRAAIQRGTNPADVNQALEDGTTALHWAVLADDLETVEALIGAGANVSTANRHGVYPAELAAINGNAAMLELLFEHGADANSANPKGQTVLMFAARTGIPEAVEVVLDHGATIDARETVGDQTALMWAVMENHPQAVEVLLTRGAAVDAATVVEQEPAPTVGNLQGIARAQNRATPVPQGGLTALFYAARNGNLETAKMLVEAGADVTHKEAFGATPLLVATINAYADVASYLLEMGADPNAVDGFGRGPLWSAVDVRNLDMAEASGENGIDDRAEWLELIQAMLDAGADPNIATNREPPSRRFMMGFGARRWVVPAGETPFIRAATAADLDAMRLLLAHGADPHHVTKPGVTALMAAAGIGWVSRQTYTESPEHTLEAVKMCLELGVDVNATSAEGYRAIHGAALRGMDEVIEVLAAAGADLNVVDRKGRTPAGLADGTQYLGGTPSDRRDSTIVLLKRLGADSGTETPR